MSLLDNVGILCKYLITSVYHVLLYSFFFLNIASQFPQLRILFLATFSSFQPSWLFCTCKDFLFVYREFWLKIAFKSEDKTYHFLIMIALSGQTAGNLHMTWDFGITLFICYQAVRRRGHNLTAPLPAASVVGSGRLSTVVLIHLPNNMPPAPASVELKLVNR